MKQWSSIAVVLTLVLSACSNSDDPAGPDPSETTDLTFAEASALAGVFAAEALGATEGQGPATSGSEVVPFDFEVAVTVPCPLGGEVAFTGAMSGAFDTETDALSLSFAASQVHAGCAVDADGVTVTVNGNPGLELASELSIAGDPPEGTHMATLSGGFDWATSDGRSGTCSVDLTANLDVGTEVGTAGGTFCGYTVGASIG
jgi:hypothetical protein